MVSGKDLSMIPQSTPAEHASTQELSPQEAFVALLIASARADGSVSAHEANSIEHIVAGMRLFRDHRGDGLQKMFTTASEHIRDHGVPSVIQAAAAIVPKEDCPPGSKVTSSAADKVSFTLGPGCNVALATAFGGGDCCSQGPGEGSGDGACSWTFGKCAGHNLSHVDVIVCCCG